MKGNIFSSEDKEFMEIVNSDITIYIQKNLFPSRTVLVFPPFNGFRRFLIHKLIEDNFASSEVAAFSIGQDSSRRIVVCYKGLIREDQSKGLSSVTQIRTGTGMIDKGKPSKLKSTPTAAVYRPPAVRRTEARQNLGTDSDEAKSDSKRPRIRRPDLQVYVPRPKRCSLGSELLRSRSPSRVSLESSSNETRNKSLENNDSRTATVKKSQNSSSSSSSEEHVVLERLEGRPVQPSKKGIISTENTYKDQKTTTDLITKDKSVDQTESNLNFTKTCLRQLVQSCREENNSRRLGERLSEKNVCNEEIIKNISEKLDNDNLANQLSHKQSREMEAESIQKDCPVNETQLEYVEKNFKVTKKLGESNNEETKGFEYETKPNKYDTLVETAVVETSNEQVVGNVKTCEVQDVKETKQTDKSSLEPMETVTISSDSRDSTTCSTTTSSSDSKSDNETSKDSEEPSSVHNGSKDSETMDLDYSESSDNSKEVSKYKKYSILKNPEKVKSAKNTIVSEVLVISDSTSSSNNSSSRISKGKEEKTNRGRCDMKKSKSDKMNVKCENKIKSVDVNECDWESLYDDTGECLVPDLMEELTNSVGRVRVTSVSSDYRPYQSIEERTNDGECVIEIYDFPVEFKTTDLLNIFAAYRNKNFQLKWVDDTHALGVFPSPLIADEVLACTFPFVKTRPLRLAIAESRSKARNLVLPALPSAERPKTCTALARRLVSGALGLRLPTSSQEREKERQVLKEAREKRRQEAKEREAAWEGTLTSNNCI